MAVIEPPLGLTLYRIISAPDGVSGMLVDDWDGRTPRLVTLTLERPWLNNEKSKSCIPAGSYEVVRGRHRLPRMTHDFETFEVKGVPGRSGILFHPGNRYTDSEGCILTGQQFAANLVPPFIGASGEGMKNFMAVMEGRNRWNLNIVDAGRFETVRKPNPLGRA